MATPTNQQLLDAAKQAELDLLQRGQDASVNGRRYTRADLPELRKLIDMLERRIARAARGGVRVGQVVPRG